MDEGDTLRPEREPTYYDPDHSKPHCSAPSQPFCQHEVDETAGKAAQVVNGDNDACEAVIGMIHGVEEVIILHDPGEDTLIVTWRRR